MARKLYKIRFILLSILVFFHCALQKNEIVKAKYQDLSPSVRYILDAIVDKDYSAIDELIGVHLLCNNSGLEFYNYRVTPPYTVGNWVQGCKNLLKKYGEKNLLKIIKDRYYPIIFNTTEARKGDINEFQYSLYDAIRFSKKIEEEEGRKIKIYLDDFEDNKKYRTRTPYVIEYSYRDEKTISLEKISLFAEGLDFNKGATSNKNGELTKEEINFLEAVDNVKPKKVLSYFDEKVRFDQPSCFEDLYFQNRNEFLNKNSCFYLEFFEEDKEGHPSLRGCIEKHEKLYIFERDKNSPKHIFGGATRVLFFVHRNTAWCALYFKYDSNKKPLLIQYTYDL